MQQEVQLCQQIQQVYDGIKDLKRELSDIKADAPEELQPVWSGSVYWQGSLKYDSVIQPRVVRRLSCKVSCRLTATGDPIVNTENWPNKLNLQLIPQQIISTYGKEHIKKARYVTCDLSDSKGQDLEILTQAVTQGYVGFIHLNTPGWEFRVMILLYSPSKNSYIGVITDEQKEFLVAIKRGIMAHDKKEVVKQEVQQQFERGAAQNVLKSLLQPLQQNAFLDNGFGLNREQEKAGNPNLPQGIPFRNAPSVAVMNPYNPGFNEDEDQEREKSLEEVRQLGLAIDRDQQLLQAFQTRMTLQKLQARLLPDANNVPKEPTIKFLGMGGNASPAYAQPFPPAVELMPEQREQKNRHQRLADMRRAYLNPTAPHQGYEQEPEPQARLLVPDANDVTKEFVNKYLVTGGNSRRAYVQPFPPIIELTAEQREQKNNHQRILDMRKAYLNSTVPYQGYEQEPEVVPASSRTIPVYYNVGTGPPNTDAKVYDPYQINLQPVQARTDETGNLRTNEKRVLQLLLDEDDQPHPFMTAYYTGGTEPPNADAKAYAQLRRNTLKAVQERTEETGNLRPNEMPSMLKPLLDRNDQPSISIRPSTSKCPGEFAFDLAAPSTSSIQDCAALSFKRKHTDDSMPLKTKQVKITKHAADVVDQTFSCLVCQGPMRHPVFTSCCCKSIVACRECSMQWSSRSNKCLKCQAENPVYTEVLGLHEGIRALMDCNFFD